MWTRPCEQGWRPCGRERLDKHTKGYKQWECACIPWGSHIFVTQKDFETNPTVFPFIKPVVFYPKCAEVVGGMGQGRYGMGNAHLIPSSLADLWGHRGIKTLSVLLSILKASDQCGRKSSDHSQHEQPMSIASCITLCLKHAQVTFILWFAIFFGFIVHVHVFVADNHPRKTF